MGQHENPCSSWDKCVLSPSPFPELSRGAEHPPRGAAGSLLDLPRLNRRVWISHPWPFCASLAVILINRRAVFPGGKE